MNRNALGRALLSCAALVLCCLAATGAHAQDSRQPDERARWTPRLQGWRSLAAPDGFTTWRKDIGSGCQGDHQYSLDIPADPANLSDITYSMSNFDVDYGDAQGCPGGPEVDLMYFNEQSLGFLTGANNAWSVNSWPLTASQLVKGANSIRIDTDSTGTGCWCVGVGYIEVRAKVGFKVKSHTPQADDKNRDFHAGKVDLTVTLTSEYDASTLTPASFLLEYRDPSGAWQQVAGGRTQLAPEQFRFLPGANLKDGVRYRATVKGGASGLKSKEGGELDADEVWYFHTVPDLSVSDVFDYGGGSTCPPSSAPCPGVELAIFQVARNAVMVPGGKEAVARIYLRWKKHTDVHDADQTLSSEFETSLTVGGATFNQRTTIERPDRYTAAQKEVAAHTVNIKHTPASAFSYSAEVTPQPQTNATPVKYTQSRTLTSSGRSPRITFDYYFLKDGAWSGGVPAADQANGLATLTAGTQLITDQFPVLGTRFNQKGAFAIGYTYTGGTVNFSSCGSVREVTCPVGGQMAELLCAYNTFLGMRGGHKFVAVTTPNTLCPPATGFAIGDKVFVHQSGTSANEGTIAHEVGHIYGLSTANNPTPKHRNDNTQIEGFQVRTNTNRSYVENVTKPLSLMHTTVQATGTQWIDNSDYATLLGGVTLTGMHPEAEQALVNTAAPFLIVSGFIDVEAGGVQLSPSFLQEVPNEPPSATGTCRVELQDGGGAVLAGDFVTPEIDISFERGPGPWLHPSAAAAGPQPFSVSLPWSAGAQSLQVSCHGAVLFTKQRTEHAPAADFLGLPEGAVLSGTQTLNWAGSDADNDALAYQLQLSSDGGASWSPLTPVMRGTRLELDTNLLASGASLLRLMSTDGFNTSWAVRSVSFVNALRVTSVLPAKDAGNVGIGTSVSVLLTTELDETSLSDNTFQLIDNYSQRVPGRVSYDRASRTALFTPTVPLKHNTRYTARLESSIQDIQGNLLGDTYVWSFSTTADGLPPVVVRTHPVPGARDVPLNALVQVNFNEPMDSATLAGSSLTLLDASGRVVNGRSSPGPQSQAALFTASAPLLPDMEYTAVVSPTVKDLAGNPLGSSHSWTFTTGKTATSNSSRIIGNYTDQADDTNGDKLFDQLVLSVDVEVLVDGGYNLNGRLLDPRGTLLGWQTGGDLYLARGIHTLKLVFSGIPIRSNGVDGPYVLDALSFYPTRNPADGDVRYKVYQTFPYRAASFYSALLLSKLPDQLLEWNTRREPAFNLRDYTSHATLPILSVSYEIQINTDARVGLSIDTAGRVNIRPQPGVEAESDVVILARDPLMNQVTSAFHISVQKPHPARLEAPAELLLAPYQAERLEVRVKDQWNRLITSPVTMTFETTVGTISPASVSTSTGQASTTLTAGSTVGAGFVTTRLETLSALTRIQAATSSTWRRLGNMGFMRAQHQAVRLADGRVLLVGGWTTSAELYEPSTGRWQPAGTLSLARRAFTLTVLGDGRVLAVGGGRGEAETSAELYEPTTRTWRRTGSMAIARKAHTATVLPDGRVLVAGGGGPSTAAELYDPTTGAWSLAGDMASARGLHTATRLEDGRVLVTGGSAAGGSPLASAELYDPARSTWSVVGSMKAARTAHSATLLRDGKVLVVGGATGALAHTSERYDPATATWSSTGAMAQPRRDHTATLMPSGQVLVAGGYDASKGILTSAELFEPTTGAWRATASMNVGRYNHTATLTTDGRVLVTGGQSNGDQASVELFNSNGF